MSKKKTKSIKYTDENLGDIKVIPNFLPDPSELVLKKNVDRKSIPWDEYMRESLKDKKEAALYLTAILEACQEDGNIEALILGLRRVTEVHGDLGKFIKT